MSQNGIASPSARNDITSVWHPIT